MQVAHRESHLAALGLEQREGVAHFDEERLFPNEHARILEHAHLRLARFRIGQGEGLLEQRRLDLRGRGRAAGAGLAGWAWLASFS